MRKYVYILLLLFVGFALSGELTAKTKKRRTKARVHTVAKRNTSRRPAVKAAPKPVEPV